MAMESEMEKQLGQLVGHQIPLRYCDPLRAEEWSKNREALTDAQCNLDAQIAVLGLFGPKCHKEREPPSATHLIDKKLLILGLRPSPNSCAQPVPCAPSIPCTPPIACAPRIPCAQSMQCAQPMLCAPPNPGNSTLPYAVATPYALGSCFLPVSLPAPCGQNYRWNTPCYPQRYSDSARCSSALGFANRSPQLCLFTRPDAGHRNC